VLVIVGGFDGENILDSVEVYSPNGRCNFHLAPLPQPVYELFAIFFRGNLFACGGDVGRQCWRYALSVYLKLSDRIFLTQKIFVWKRELRKANVDYGLLD
jgi:hypothetical protein